VEIAEDIRRKLRRWLGIAAIQRQLRDLEGRVTVSAEDLERINAATSRIAAKVAALLDKIDELGTGNDDEVRAQAQLEATQQASAELRPLIDQLETLGADAAQPVPDPGDGQVPVEPGPDVPPVENPDDGGLNPGTGDGSAGDPIADEPVVVGEPDPTQTTPDDTIPATEGGQGGTSQPGPTDEGDGSSPDFSRRRY
jgi:hypothetical protein